jgi:hypothetical protein
MKAFFVWVVAVCVGLVAVGCAEEAETTEAEWQAPREDDEAKLVYANTGASSSSSSSSGIVSTNPPTVDPCAPYEPTTLPCKGVGDVLVICSQCGKMCESTDSPCELYGAPCEIDGAPGVCKACCDGLLGVLQCGTL